MTYKEIRKNKEINAFLDKGNESLTMLGYDENMVELAKIAGYMHDIGNAFNRTHHSEYGAMLANDILRQTDMTVTDRVTVVSCIAKNIITQYGFEPEELSNAALAAFAKKGKLADELNTLKTQIEDLTAQLKVLKKYRKVKGVAAELKPLSGRQAQKYRKEHSSELNDYGNCRQQILEWYPSGHIPSVEQMEQKINALRRERSQKNEEYMAVKQKSGDLAKAQRDIEEYLRNERKAQEQNRRRKKNGDLE